MIPQWPIYVEHKRSLGGYANFRALTSLALKIAKWRPLQNWQARLLMESLMKYNRRRYYREVPKLEKCFAGL